MDPITKAIQDFNTSRQQNITIGDWRATASERDGVVSNRSKRNRRLERLLGSTIFSVMKFPASASPYDARSYIGLHFEDGIALTTPGSQRSALGPLYSLLGLPNTQRMLGTGGSASTKEIYSVNETWTPISVYAAFWTYTNKTITFIGYNSDMVEVARQMELIDAYTPRQITFSQDFERITRLAILPEPPGGTHLGGLLGSYIAMHHFHIEFPDRSKRWAPNNEIIA